jgi:hypothetical protein
MFKSVAFIYRYTFFSVMLFLSAFLMVPSVISKDSLVGRNVDLQVVQQVQFNGSSDYSLVLA